MAEQSSAKPLPRVLAGREAGSESTTSAPPRRPFLFLLGAITIPVIILDQATKLFVQAHMALYESIAIIPNYLDITYTQNPGAAFSMLADAPPWVRKAFLLTMACAAIIVLLVIVVRGERVAHLGFMRADPWRRDGQSDRSSDSRPRDRLHARALLRPELSHLQCRRQRDLDWRRADPVRDDFRP